MSASAGQAFPICVGRAISVIDERYRETLTLPVIALAVDRHRGHLSRVFRQATGRTVHGYLALVRVTNAARLIAGGEKIEVAMLEVGYRSKKNFYRQFRLLTGLTPGAYRGGATRRGVA